MLDIDNFKMAEDLQSPINFYRAEVITNRDPLELCRVQVKIFGLTDDIPIDCQPWIEMQHNVRLIQYPDPKDIIWIFLENGDIFKPVYLGTTYSPEGPNSAKELRYVQSDLNKNTYRFKGNVTHAPYDKLLPQDGKARDWWLETTIRSFKDYDDLFEGAPFDGVADGGNEDIVVDALPLNNGHWSGIEMDDHIGAERLQLLFQESEGYLCFSHQAHEGVELYSCGTINLETMNQYGAPNSPHENQFRFQDAGLDLWSDKANWLRSTKWTHINSSEYLHLESLGELNLQSLGSLTALRATGGDIKISATNSITIGPEGDGTTTNVSSTKESLMINHDGDTTPEGLYSFPVLGGDGQGSKGKYFLYLEADSKEEAAEKMSEMSSFFMWIRFCLESIKADAPAKTYAGQIGGGIFTTVLSGMLDKYKQGMENATSIQSQHMIEGWKDIKIKSEKDNRGDAN